MIKGRRGRVFFQELWFVGEITVPKMKTKKSVQARFKVTGTGKLLRSRPGRRHILTKKTAKRKRQLARPALVDKDQLKMYKRLMCV